jgi:hypothetical protein
MKIYYFIDKETFKKNSSNNKLFETKYMVYSDKKLKKKVGEIYFITNNMSNSNNEKNIIQGNIVNLILFNGTTISYNYIRNGFDKIKNRCSFSNNSNINMISRKYMSKELRKLELC